MRFWRLPLVLRLRPLVQVGLLALTAFLAVELWLVDGLVRPFRVEGSSMAPGLLGVHRDVRCNDCGYCFPCDANPQASRAVCPNCGWAGNDLQSLPEVDADRVLLDRTTLALRPPRRWEVVAFRHPQQADRFLVKRVVGLPGETIEIRHGDVYANGQIQRKDLEQQRAMAILVHDAGFVSRHEPALPRWRPEGPHTRWSTADQRFVRAAANPTLGQAESIDWLTYHNERRLPGNAGVQESPVTDVSSYNPAQSRREEDVSAVADLMVSFRLETLSGDGAFCVRLDDGRDRFEVRLEKSGRVGMAHLDRLAGLTADQGNTRVGHAHPTGIGDRAMVEVSLIDRQFLVAIDGVPCLAEPCEDTEPSAVPPACPIAIGCQGIGATVCDLRVFRDVYYTGGLGGSRQLGGNEYYVAGDNSPMSDDSRTWPGHKAIDDNLLLGKPFVAIPSISTTLGGAGHFQVPNLAGIRYIR